MSQVQGMKVVSLCEYADHQYYWLLDLIMTILT